MGRISKVEKMKLKQNKALKGSNNGIYVFIYLKIILKKKIHFILKMKRLSLTILKTHRIQALPVIYQ